MKRILSSSALVLFLASAFVLGDQSSLAHADTNSVSTTQATSNDSQTNNNDNEQQENGEQSQQEAEKQANAKKESDEKQEAAKKEAAEKQEAAKKEAEKNKFVDHVNFTYSSAINYNARNVNVNGIKSFVGPYNRGTHVKKSLNLKGQLVQLTNVARAKERTYYQINYRGQDQGWINATYLSTTNVYEIPFTYTSQHFPFDAPNGCEATALKISLSTKGVGENIGLNGFLKKMPRAKYDHNKGFVGNPYAVNHTNQDWTIYPKALAAFGRKFYDGVYDITGASKIKIINEVQHGNPVIAATGYRMRKATGHTLVVVGYKRGYFKMADPSSWRATYKTTNKPVFWTSTSQFMSLYNHEGRKAVLVK
ncbi:C39 family peptidase [Apilactobacillus quenuiae]|uniref:C39 family peptidase n=1 Tax=Apilactobacillus quenuiae TaxID=2008377 RepID=UPI00142E60B3|nr:C39 family peptidase [Apilactobacillus quenuiae]